MAKAPYKVEFARQERSQPNEIKQFHYKEYENGRKYVKPHAFTQGT